MNIAVIGCGFVGKALINGFKDSVSVLKIDPILNTSISDVEDFKPSIIFICVPTPMSENSEQDLSILNKVFAELNNITLSIKPLIVLKSTVLPNHIRNYSKNFKDFVYNPEFLTERNANEDFINSELIVFGGKNSSNKKLGEFYKKHTKCINKDYLFTDLISASLIKYSINSFLATKVIFFNELFHLFQKSGSESSWDSFINILSNDSRIGSSHMKVPGIDKRYGFGGACFPKDTLALYKYSSNKGSKLNLLKFAIDLNNIIRSEYNSPTNREATQKIIFNKDI